MPKPTLYLGQIEEGSTVSKSRMCSETRLFPKYPPSVPLDAQFSVVSYSVGSSSAPRDAKGTGNVLNSEAKAVICNSPAGSTIFINTLIRFPDGSRKRKNVAYMLE